MQLVIAGASVTPPPPGYAEKDGKVNYKTYCGDIYSTAINDNRYALPPDAYVKADHRLTMKDAGRYLCTPDFDGRHGDTFDSGKLAELMLVGGAGGAFTPEAVSELRQLNAVAPATGPRQSAAATTGRPRREFVSGRKRG